MQRRIGRCLCGDLAYEALVDLAPVVNCHCGFCRRVHGAPLTTVAFLPLGGFVQLPSSAEPSRFTTPLGNLRHFCPRCSTPVYNTRPGLDVACLVVSSLEEASQPSPWFHVNLESKAPWFEVGDDLPRFQTWPSPREVGEFARSRNLQIPGQLFGVC